jgi:hypothetical protein
MFEIRAPLFSMTEREVLDRKRPNLNLSVLESVRRIPDSGPRKLQDRPHRPNSANGHVVVGAIFYGYSKTRLAGK